MEITIKHEQNLTIALKGRLDTITSADLDTAFKNEVVNEDLVVFDFTEVEYISSAGLRVILAIKKSLEANNKHLEIHNINDVVKEVFTVTGFINILTIK